MNENVEKINIVRLQNEKIQSGEYYVHYKSINDRDINCHTHGLNENMNHMDLQIVLNLPVETCISILYEIITYIDKGLKFKENQLVYDGDGQPILFIKVQEDNRDVLRIIFSDENKLLPFNDKCDYKYKRQMIC